MIKRKNLAILFSVIIAVLLFGCAFMLAPKTTAHADTEETHDHSTMTAINSYADIENGELTTGAYVLTDNIDGNITVTGEVTLCLNGHTVTGDGNGSVITVSVNASFTLCDCNEECGKITGGNIMAGGGVFVDGGTFEMTGGTISGNTAAYFGGGVGVDGGTFKMTGGTIKDNVAGQYGGGVYVNNGTFTMSGTAEISGNSIDGGMGGGVFISVQIDEEVITGESTFTMTGGSISGNEAALGGGVGILGAAFTMENGEIKDNIGSYGAGGVLLLIGTFEMTGGEISGNAQTGDMGLGYCGGVCVGYSMLADEDGEAIFEISGAPVITGNKVTIDGNEVENNVVVAEGYIITVAGELTVGAQIGVNNTGEIATGFTQDDKPLHYFISDNPDYNCIYVSDETNGTVTIGEHNWENAPWMFNNVAHWHACQNGCGTSNDTDYHNFNQEVVNDICLKSAATCTAKAVYYKSCECGQPMITLDADGETFEYGEALGHDIITHEAKAATCTENGWQAYEGCSRCDYLTDKVEISALGHKYGDWVTTKEATESEDGEQRRVCENDEAHYETRTLPKLTPSTPTPEKPSAPTEETKSYWWLFWLLIPLAIGVGGVTLGIWVYKNDKKNNRK